MAARPDQGLLGAPPIQDLLRTKAGVAALGGDDLLGQGRVERMRAPTRGTRALVSFQGIGKSSLPIG